MGSVRKDSSSCSALNSEMTALTVSSPSFLCGVRTEEEEDDEEDDDDVVVGSTKLTLDFVDLVDE